MPVSSCAYADPVVQEGNYGSFPTTSGDQHESFSDKRESEDAGSSWLGAAFNLTNSIVGRSR